MTWLVLLILCLCICGGIWYVSRNDEDADPWQGPKAMLAEGREMVAMGQSLIDEGQVEAGKKMIAEGQRRIRNAYNLLPDELEE